MKTISERKLARYYPWILAGLFVLYFGSFPVLNAPILVVIPTIVAGWFYYQLGGGIASIVMIVVNLFLINLAVQKVTWEFLFDFENGVLLGHGLSIVATIGIGYMRRIIERYYWTYLQLQKRERHPVLTNMASKDILEGGDLGDTYYRLLTHLTNLFTADYAYLTRFDPSTQNIVLVADTRNLIQSFDSKLWESKLAGTTPLF